MENRRRTAGIPLPGLATALVAGIGLLIGWMAWEAAEAERQEQEVARLKDDIRDPEATLGDRVRSIELWVRDGSQAVPRLLAELDNPSPKVREAIALALARIRPPENAALAALDRLLDDPETEVRLGALSAWLGVAEFHESAVRPHLPRILRSFDETDDELRNEALSILRRCAASPGVEVATPEVRGELIRLTQSSQPRARQLAARGIRLVRVSDAESVSALRRLLQDSTPAVRDEAFQSLTALGAVTMHESIEALSSSDPETRSLACRILASLEEAAAPATETLRGLLKSGEGVEAALTVLAAIGPQAEAALPEVLSVLEESRSDQGSRRGNQASHRAVRHGLALHCLARIVREPSRAVPHVRESLTDAHLRVAGVAGESLAALSPEAAAAEAQRLIAQLDGADHRRARSIVAALGGLGRHAVGAVPALIELVDHPEPSISWYAVESLGRLGVESASAVPALTAHLGADRTGRNWAGAELTLQSLRRIAGRSEELERLALELIKDGLESVYEGRESSDGHLEAVSEALLLLGVVAQGSETSYQELLAIYESLVEPMLGRHSERLRTSALRSLAALGVRQEETVDVLLAAARDESSLRVVALRGLGGFPEGAEQSVPLLIEALGSQDPQACVAAALALGELGKSAGPAVPHLQAIAEAPLNAIPIDGSLSPGGLANNPDSILRRPLIDPIEELAALSPRRAARLSLQRIEPE